MGHIIGFYLQATEALPIDWWDKIERGAVAVCFIVIPVVVVLWRQLLTERKALADLNASVRKDAIDNIRIIDALASDIRKRGDHDQKILDMVTDVLIILKTKYTENVRKNDPVDESKRNS